MDQQTYSDMIVLLQSIDGKLTSLSTDNTNFSNLVNNTNNSLNTLNTLTQLEIDTSKANTTLIIEAGNNSATSVTQVIEPLKTELAELKTTVSKIQETPQPVTTGQYLPYFGLLAGILLAVVVSVEWSKIL